MLNVTVIGVGRIKEKYFTAALGEYEKRLGRYCRLNLIEVRDEPTPDAPSERERDLVLDKEGKRILDTIPDTAYVTALCFAGRQMASEDLAETLENLAAAGSSHLVFVIGGSMGLSRAVKERSALKLSFSPMTFPHQLMRVILLDQIYRAFTILQGGKYHK